MGLDDLTVTSQRSQVVDFSTPYETSTLQVMIQVRSIVIKSPHQNSFPVAFYLISGKILS